MKKILLAAIVLIIVTGGCVQPPAEKKELQIGFVTPLSGESAFYGESELHALTLAVDEINANGGILGQQVIIIPEDGRCNAKDAISAAQKLLEIDNVKIILGGFCSSETLGMAPLTEQKKALLFSASSSSPAVTDAGELVFRNFASDAYGAKAIAQRMIADGHERIAVLSENTDYSQALAKSFIQQAQASGVQVVSHETFSGPSTDFRSFLLKIKESDPQAVFLNPQAGVAGGLAAKQLRELDINAVLYGGFTFNGTDSHEAGGEALNGLKFIDAPGLKPDNLKAKAFLEKFNARFGAPAHDYMAGSRYDSMYLIAQAIESCNDVNTQCIAAYLYNVQFEGVIGSYGFDSNGDVDGIEYIVKQIVDAKTNKVVQLTE